MPDRCWLFCLAWREPQSESKSGCEPERVSPQRRPRERTQWNRASLRWNALLNALDPGFHCARTHWIRGFMAFQLARRTQIVLLVVPV
jgi:hypothetical protein